jgi:hypothetical protein
MTPFTRSRNAAAWLRDEPVLAALGEQASRLAALQVELDRCAPGLGLAVVALERDTLVVGAAHAAVAAKMRQVGPTLLAGLARAGWRIETIRFRPQWRPPPTRPAPRSKPPLDARAVAGIAALSEGIADPALKAALQRLAARHAPRPG